MLPEGTKEIEVDEATVGDIVKLSKLKKSAAGNTVAHKDRQLKLELPEMPEPMISKSSQPKSKGDIDKISGGLARLAESDPTFKWENDPETNETVISGLGSVHLDIMIERLKKLFSVDVEVGKPKIAYRETVRKTVEADYKHKKQTVVTVNTDTFRSKLSLMNVVPVLSSLIKSSAGSFRKTISLQLRKVSLRQ
jgi:elongation factor G